MSVLDAARVDGYLARIGAARPERADLAALRHLQVRHVLSVPFENLDYHLGRSIHMDQRVLEKIVDMRRGGGCYEVNPAFGMLLRALGFDVRIRAAAVFRPGGLGALFGHLVLEVDLDQPYLVDVGFRRTSRWPLRVGMRAAQNDPHGNFRILPCGDDSAYDVHLNDEPLYRVDPRPCAVEDFQPTLWWFRTSPQSPFLRDLFCSLPTDDGRITLKSRHLTTRLGARTTTELLTDDVDVLASYQRYFGFVPETLPAEPPVAPSDGGVRVE